MCAMGWGTPTGCVSVTGRVCVCVWLGVSGCVYVGCIGARHVYPPVSHFPVAGGAQSSMPQDTGWEGVVTERFSEPEDCEVKHHVTRSLCDLS